MVPAFLRILPIDYPAALAYADAWALSIDGVVTGAGEDVAGAVERAARSKQPRVLISYSPPPPGVDVDLDDWTTAGRCEAGGGYEGHPGLYCPSLPDVCHGLTCSDACLQGVNG